MNKKYIIEIAETHTHYDDNKKPYKVHRVKGFNSLFLDDYALAKLEKLNEDSFFTDEELRRIKINNYVDFFKERIDVKTHLYDDIIYLALSEILRREESEKE